MDEHMEYMDDSEIQEKVESLVGKGTRVVDCKKSTSFETQEVLLVNGHPIPLHGDEGIRIKEALLEGQVPPGDILNEILIRAGILKAPVELETTMNVKSTKKFTELLTFRDKNGILIDERMKETEEDNEFNGTSTERWKTEANVNVESETDLTSLAKRVDKVHIGNVLKPTHVLDGIVSPRLSHSPQANQTTEPEANTNDNTSSSSSSTINNNSSNISNLNNVEVSDSHTFSKIPPVETFKLKPQARDKIVYTKPKSTFPADFNSSFGSSSSSNSSQSLFNSPPFLKSHNSYSNRKSTPPTTTSDSSLSPVPVPVSSPVSAPASSVNYSSSSFTVDYMTPIMSPLQRAKSNKVPVRISYETFV